MSRTDLAAQLRIGAVLVLAGLVAAPACGLLAAADGGLYAWLGLPDPGLAQRVLVPTMRAVAELGGAVAVGSLLHAAFVAPPRAPGALDVDGWLALRRAGWCAAVAGLAALALSPLLAADLTGADHDRATDASAVQTLAAAVVTGVLLSLLLHLRRGGPHRELVVRRTGRLVATAWPVLMASAAVAAAVTAGAAPLSAPAWTAVVAAQLTTLAIAGGRGLLLWRGGRASAAAAVLLAGAVVALLLRIVLSRRTPPRFLDGTDTPTDVLIGYDLPEPVSAASLLLDWRFNLIFGTGRCCSPSGTCWRSGGSRGAGTPGRSAGPRHGSPGARYCSSPRPPEWAAMRPGCSACTWSPTWR